MCAKEKAAKVIEVKVLNSLQILPFSDKDTQGHTRTHKVQMDLQSTLSH